MESDPYRNDTLEQATDYNRLALDLLARHAIPPSPIHVRLAYECVAQRNPALQAKINELLEEPQEAVNERLWELYRTFFNHEEGALAKLREELLGVILGIQDEFQHSGRHLSEYADKLGRFASFLTAPGNQVPIGSEVQKVIDDTNTLKDSQTQLHTNMQSIVQEMEALRNELKQVREESLTDPLTGIANRRAFDSVLQEVLQQSEQDGRALSLLLIDIDHFKQFNDTHGHPTGDKVLRFVATTLKRCLKGSDTPCRYGGEEFAVILPNTGLEGARAVAQQVRQTINSRMLRDSSGGKDYGRIAVSVGGAQFRPGEDELELVARVDAALYKAKAQGRNRVVATP